MLYSYVGSGPLKVMVVWLNALQLCGFKSRCIGWMLLQLCGFKSPPSQAGLVEYFTAMWVQDPSKSHWTGWVLYSYVGSSPLQFTVDWLNALQICLLKSCWIGWMLYSYVGSSVLQVMMDWLNALQLCGFKSPPSYTGLVECFTATWAQVPSKSRWIGWMLYSYVGSSPLQVVLDWLNALQLCGFKSSPSHTGLVECFTAMWVQDLSKLCWIGWMLYSHVGSRPLQVMVDWLNALQTCGFKSCWNGWMLYSYMGSSALQVTVDWLNALELHGFKFSSSHG